MILHGYDLSPFAEKVRVAFGMKDVSWRAVDIPVWPPRPDTVPLTAGYRRVPALQIGADVYCDTARILAEIERRVPEPTLYPAGQAGLATILGSWAETALFLPAARLTTSIIGDGVPDDFIRDRIAFMGQDFTRAASLRDLPVSRQRTVAAMRLLAEVLGDGRAFLLGSAPSAADLGAYHVLWFVRRNGGAEAEAMLPFAPLLDWMGRIAAFGHGDRSPMSPAEALEAARLAEPEPTGGVEPGDPSGLAAGTAVRLVADEANDPIEGTLVAADATEIVLRVDSERTGAVHVHFPRAGYSVVAAT